MAARPVVFVFGTGRCGTHSLWKLFESVPGALSTHEGAGVIRHGPADSLGKRIALGPILELNAYLYHAATEEVFRRTFDPIPALQALLDGCWHDRARLMEWCEANGLAYCDANPFAFNLIDYLRIRYPSAKFIHLVRDGYACVRSWARRVGSTYPDDVVSRASISWTLAKPIPLPSDPAHAAWSSFDRVQRISWFWHHVNANIAERFARVPSAQRMTIRIEDFDATTAARLLEFCELPDTYDPAALGASDPSSGPSIEWTPEAIGRFNAIAGATMAGFGYALRPGRT
jgi:hypothetical protein